MKESQPIRNVPVVQAQVLNVSPYPTMESAIPQPPINPTIKTLNAYNLSRSVMIFSLIDMFFCFIYSLYNLYYFFPLMIAGIGYYGAKHWNKKYILCYLIYLFLQVIGKSIIWAYSLFLITQNDGYDYVSFTMWTAITIICEVYISRIVYKFYRSLSELTEEEIAVGKTLKYRQYRIVYW